MVIIMTAETLKGYVDQTLKILSIIAALTTTKIDDVIVDALKTLSGNDALLDLVAGWLTDKNVKVPKELQADWNMIQPSLSVVKKIVEA